MVTALDSNHSKIKCLQKLYKGSGNVNFIQMDINNLSSFTLKYDLLIIIDVMEHINDDISLIKSCYERLNEKGLFVLHIPHKDFDPEGKFGLRKLRRKKQVHLEHLRKGYSKSELVEIFSSGGFKNIQIQYTIGPLSMFAHTVFEFYRGHNYLLYFLLHPILMLFAYIELFIGIDNLKCGGGLILSAEKHSI